MSEPHRPTKASETPVLDVTDAVEVMGLDGEVVGRILLSTLVTLAAAAVIAGPISDEIEVLRAPKLDLSQPRNAALCYSLLGV